MKHTNERVFSYTKKGALLASAVLLAAGCKSEVQEVPPTPGVSVPSTPEANITMYKDAEFTRALGKVVSFDVLCADYKDSDIPSLQPEHVIRYEAVESDPAQHSPKLEGYVDPQSVSMIVGVAPAC